jgi:DNA-binding transcriptional ArsR family regulator
VEKSRIIDALNALAQETRLDLLRLLVAAGPNGLTPSLMSRQLKIAPPTLSFHLGRLAHAGLVRSRRRGRSIGYSADSELVTGLLAALEAHLRPQPAETPAEPLKAKDAKDVKDVKDKDTAPAGTKAAS